MKENQIQAIDKLIKRCKADWRIFAREILEANLDPEQEEILQSIQFNKKVAVASGTARGKDYVAACAAMCFFYLTPVFDADGKKLLENTKVILTAPTERQVLNVMMPEIARFFSRMQQNGFHKIFGGKLTASDIRMADKEHFLTGFKADEHNHEAWTGLHAANMMFVVTEASGIPESVFNAIEGNLQGNSRLLLVFNRNSGTGYAANALRSSSFVSHRLDSLNAPNVIYHKEIKAGKRKTIPGQVEWEWVDGRVREWCSRITKEELNEYEGDFVWPDEDGNDAFYRPTDLFRIKVRGMAPKVSDDTLIPDEWIEAANKRWIEFTAARKQMIAPLRLAADIAGMGTDSTCFCHRYGDYVKQFDMMQGNGQANHMQAAGRILQILKTADNSNLTPTAFIDTIGEGAGVYSRLREQIRDQVYSVKFSEKPEWKGKPLTDKTKEYEFLNMRAYLYWCIRDWLNPHFNPNAMLPIDDELMQELTNTKYEFMSNGSIKIESKDNIKKKIKRSPDKADALAMTFYPADAFAEAEQRKKQWHILQRVYPF